MKLFLTISLFVLFSGNFLSAQVVLKTSKDSLPQKTKIKVSVLDPHGKKPIPYSGHSMHSDSVQHALKLHPVNFIRGDFSLYYEYRLAHHFSLEAAAGITYIDYMYEVFENGSRFISKANEGNSAKFYSGFSGRFQFRWYPSKYETAITGYYLAPEISYRSYKMDYFINTGLIAEPHRLNRKYTDFKIQFGHQDADPYDSFFWEWYIAAGFRHLNEDYVTRSGNDAVFENWNFIGAVVGEIGRAHV